MVRIDGETVWLEQSPFTTKVDVTTHPIQSTPTGRSVLVSGEVAESGPQSLRASLVMVTALRTSRGPDAAPPAAGSPWPATSPIPKSVDPAVKKATEANGPIDVLIANAGITDDKLMLRMGEDSFADVLDTNLTGRTDW